MKNDNDREIEFNETDPKNQKAVIILLGVFALIILASIIAIVIAFSNKNPNPSTTDQNAIQTTTTSVKTTASQASSTKSESGSTPSTTQTVTTEKPTTTTEYNADIEHGFVINNMGYTYLYYGQGFEQFNGTSVKAKNYADALNTVKSKLPENIKFYSIVAPTSVAFADIPREIRSEDKFTNTNQNSYIDNVNSNLDGFSGINIYSSFDEHKTEKLYFNTDKNWTALAAYYAYVSFAKEAGIEPISLENYEKAQIEGYLGSFYNATRSNKLYENSDIVECWLVDRKYPVEIKMYDNGYSYSNRQLVTTQISYSVSYGYYAFLGGPGQRFEIKTEKSDGKKILVIGDGSAFPFVPFLAGNYSEIYFINSETYKVNDNNPSLDVYASEKGIDEVLFISYATNTQFPNYCTKITNLCG